MHNAQAGTLAISHHSAAIFARGKWQVLNHGATIYGADSTMLCRTSIDHVYQRGPQSGSIYPSRHSFSAQSSKNSSKKGVFSSVFSPSKGHMSRFFVTSEGELLWMLGNMYAYGPANRSSSRQGSQQPTARTSIKATSCQLPTFALIA